MSNTLHTKGSRTKVLNTFPTNSFGNDGDIVASKINGRGTFLCIKAGGMWYAANQLQELRNVSKTSLKQLKAKSISISALSKSNEDTDKFVVSEGGTLKYRTGEEVLDDLDTDALSINYKTAYCSLGQYGDKETCESNGGTWYYSENDSHDSISNTAENELLTIGSSIGKIDAESTLTYDGSTLEIKRNTDYDDNWQTSAQVDLLKLSYDSSTNTIIGVNVNGDLTITPSGGDTTLKNSTLTIGTIAEVGSDTDKILMSDSGTVKYVTGANLRSYIGAGTSSFGGALNDLSDVTYSSGDLTIDSLDTIVASGNLVLDVGGDIVLNADGADITLKDNIVKIASFTQSLTGISIFYSVANESDYFKIDVAAEGATTLSTVDDGAVVGHLTLAPDGDLILDPVSQKTIINATDELYLDGGGDTKIFEPESDVVRIVVGGDPMFQLSEKGTDGNEVSFGSSSVGFTQLEPTYNASATTVDFRHSNKQNLTFDAGSITTVDMYFPSMSGNFVFLIKQDGTGSRTITNYRVRDSAGNLASGDNVAKFAGGSNPTLTTAANHVDILSFYWDADNEIAYGVATLDFQD